ncbi:4Fe-4S binding protein [Nocardia sp. NPDC046473]|uniref:4Fe-4S binding protein n=1 Tax=Nocardia sp. NPDC046473 TaxID=3155733 RepID=UPI00340F6753
MPHVITQQCCSDATCVIECPVDCIRPRPGDPEFVSAEMLYIDPDACIDCGACVPVCPVDAIRADDDLSPSQIPMAELNAAYFQQHPLASDLGSVVPVVMPFATKDARKLHVAIVGSGPAGCYTARDLLDRGARVTMFERLPVPWGLARSGIAPDHTETQRITDMFATLLDCRDFELAANITVGEHISHDELLANHHAVVYAVGAPIGRKAGIAGEELAGSHAAIEFFGWYNGNPEHSDRVFDLSGQRAVIIGNGNVALDIARILATDPTELATTDIADHALEALRRSNIREIVVLGRRGPVHAAYTAPEFLALGAVSGVDIVIDQAELGLDLASKAILDSVEVEPWVRLKVRVAEQYAKASLRPGNRRIVLRYLVSPIAIEGSDRTEAVIVERNAVRALDEELGAVPSEKRERLDTSLVLHAVGFDRAPVAGVPFDRYRRAIENVGGRAVGADGRALPGVYVVGWAKRGPHGSIGTNRADARQTVDCLAEDYLAGILGAPPIDSAELSTVLSLRRPERIGKEQWLAIDAVERSTGQSVGRPRIKLTTAAALADAARRSRGVRV